ncbi:MAG: acyltransferase [Burkholderiales bacterium]
MIAAFSSFLRRLRRRYLMLRYPSLEIGYGTVIVGPFRFRGRGRAMIGAGCRLVGVSLHVEGTLIVGDGSFLNGTSIVCRQSVTIGARGLLSDAYVTDTDFHNLEPELRHGPPGPKTMRPVRIGNNVWLGDRAVVLKGSVIGDNAVIGSHGVVRGEVPPRSVCIGNPVQIIKYL